MKRSASKKAFVAIDASVPKEWFCHCCSAQNVPNISSCYVCGRPSSYGDNVYLPLHGNYYISIRIINFPDIYVGPSKLYLRPNQVDAILGTTGIHDTNQCNWTALHHVSLAKNFQLVEHLVSNGALIEATTEHGWTPLHLCVYSGSLDITAFLVVSGADINSKTFFECNSPLHIAVQEGWFNLSSYLVEIGCDVNITNSVERTPLMIAASLGRDDIGHYLLTNKTNKANYTVMDIHGWNAQMIAEYHGYTSFVEMMVRVTTKEQQYDISELLPAAWHSPLWTQVTHARKLRTIEFLRSYETEKLLIEKMSSQDARQAFQDRLAMESSYHLSRVMARTEELLAADNNTQIAHAVSKHRKGCVGNVEKDAIEHMASEKDLATGHIHTAPPRVGGGTKTAVASSSVALATAPKSTSKLAKIGNIAMKK